MLLDVVDHGDVQPRVGSYGRIMDRANILLPDNSIRISMYLMKDIGPVEKF